MKVRWKLLLFPQQNHRFNPWNIQFYSFFFSWAWELYLLLLKICNCLWHLCLHQKKKKSFKFCMFTHFLQAAVKQLVNHKKRKRKRIFLLLSLSPYKIRSLNCVKPNIILTYEVYDREKCLWTFLREKKKKI